MKIPAVVVNFNRAEPLRLLLGWLLRADGVGPVTVLDNGSTWGPTLDLYREVERDGVVVHRFGKNLGYDAVPQAVRAGAIRGGVTIAITDPDLEPYPDTPPDMILRLAAILSDYPRVVRVGASLPYDHVPVDHFFRPWMDYWERKFWENETPCGRGYFAPLAETLAVYRSASDFLRNRESSIRAKRPLSLKHGDWALDPWHLGAEFEHYMAKAGNVSSGSAIYDTYRRNPEWFKTRLADAVARGNHRPIFDVVRSWRSR